MQVCWLISCQAIERYHLRCLACMASCCLLEWSLYLWLMVGLEWELLSQL